MSSKTLIDTDVIFIDRSGDLFRDILYYLRTGSVTTSNKKKLTSLQREAEFYQLQELANLLERHMDRANREHKEFLVRDMDFLDVSNIGVTKYIAHRQHTGKVYVYQIIGVIDVLISGYCQNHRKHGCTECHAQKLILRSSSKTLV
ncbi:hypothetical protein V8B55DRAFT_1600997 [Mucor lusitanicus]|uniref:Potassium channel tetramerisation-type BTB domain-containing protein n=1 Tax=Mucor circinelloides f. lusitanicus TaxID=29924 RepID=A0A8H4B913_MUCCL|nr:hypothetical protein FB192DRAFT_1396096 [Mucor lusitanicus]